MNARCLPYSLPLPISLTFWPSFPLIVSNEKKPSSCPGRRPFPPGIFSVPNMLAKRPPAPLWPERMMPPACGAGRFGHASPGTAAIASRT